MLSPIDYESFFLSLKNQELDKFSSVYEEKLLRYSQSQRRITKNKSQQTDQDKENIELWAELDKTIDELENQELKNELLQKNIKALSQSMGQKNNINIKTKTSTIKNPLTFAFLANLQIQPLLGKN